MVTLVAVYEHAAETPLHEAWVRGTYPGSMWDRLAAIKARHGPTTLFRDNHNIPPAVDRDPVQSVLWTVAGQRDGSIKRAARTSEEARANGRLAAPSPAFGIPLAG